MFGQIFVLQAGPEMRVEVFDDHTPIRALGCEVKFFLLFWKCKRQGRGHM
jgi:hypothetical protein